MRDLMKFWNSGAVEHSGMWLHVIPPPSLPLKKGRHSYNLTRKQPELGNLENMQYLPETSVAISNLLNQWSVSYREGHWNWIKTNETLNVLSSSIVLLLITAVKIQQEKRPAVKPLSTTIDWEEKDCKLEKELLGKKNQVCSCILLVAILKWSTGFYLTAFIWVSVTKRYIYLRVMFMSLHNINQPSKI